MNSWTEHEFDCTCAGALLARLTNDNWRATAHRVIVPDLEAARQDRYSIAAFFDPDTVRLHHIIFIALFGTFLLGNDCKLRRVGATDVNGVGASEVCPDRRGTEV